MLMDVEPAEPRKTGHHKIDFILGCTAVLLSMVSLGVAVLHGHTMERMAEANARLVQANSWPFLEVLSTNQNGADRREIAFTLSNNGVGPAKIYAASIRYKGEAIRGWDQFLGDCCSVQGEAPLPYASSTVSPIVLRAGSSVTFFTVPHPAGDSRAWDVLNTERRQVSYELCYCSVFDECWKTDGTTLHPQPVLTCPGAPPKEREM